MAKKIIAVDIDDTIGNTAEEFVRYSNDMWGTSLTEEDFDEDWAKVWGTDYEETVRRAHLIHEEDPRLFLQIGVKDHSFEVLSQLARSYTIVCATSRRRSIAPITKEWLDVNYPGIFSSLYFSGIFDEQRTGSALLTKAELLREIGADYLIDDQLKHCRAAVDNDMRAILFGTYTWNQDDNLPESVTRCHDWLEVQAFFVAMMYEI